jgi:hypothetical protein
MEIRLDYGRTGLTVNLPDDIDVSVLEPQKGTPLQDPSGAVAEAVARPIGTKPLAELARGRRDALVVISDRPADSYGLVLPPILSAIEAGGCPQRIEILVATGLHRANTGRAGGDDEPDIVARYRIRNHVARGRRSTSTSRTDAGPSCGSTAATSMPTSGRHRPDRAAPDGGLPGGRRRRRLRRRGHDAQPAARRCSKRRSARADRRQPVHAELVGIARRVGVDFMCDVTIDRARRLTGVYAGELEEAHAAGVRAVDAHVRAEIDRPADVVITSAAGFRSTTRTTSRSRAWWRRSTSCARRHHHPRGGDHRGIGSAEFQRLLARPRRPTTSWRASPAPASSRSTSGCSSTLPGPPQSRGDRREPRPRRAAADNLLATLAPTVEDALARCRARYGPRPHVAVMPEGPYVLPTVRPKLALGTRGRRRTRWRSAPLRCLHRHVRTGAREAAPSQKPADRTRREDRAARSCARGSSRRRCGSRS